MVGKRCFDLAKKLLVSLNDTVTVFFPNDPPVFRRLKVKGIFCLPRAVRLTMALKAKGEKTISDTQVINLCLPPCNKELFD